MPPPPPEPSRTVLVEGTKEVSEDSAATAASIVDAAVNSPSKDEEHTGETARVADPTVGVYESDGSISI